MARKITRDFKKEIKSAMNTGEIVTFEYWTSTGKHSVFEGIPVRFCRKDGEEAFVFKPVWGGEVRLRLASCGRKGRDNAMNVKMNNELEVLEWKSAPKRLQGPWTAFDKASNLIYTVGAGYVEISGKYGSPRSVELPLFIFEITQVDGMGNAKGRISFPEMASHEENRWCCDDELRNGKTYNLFLDYAAQETILPCSITRTGKITASIHGVNQKVTRAELYYEFFVGNSKL